MTVQPRKAKKSSSVSIDTIAKFVYSIECECLENSGGRRPRHETSRKGALEKEEEGNLPGINLYF